jgi:hypothetical protein
MARKSTSDSQEVELRGADISVVDSWESALSYLQANGVEVIDTERAAELLDDGFAFLDQKGKGQLVNVPFIILDCKFGWSQNFQRAGDDGEAVPLPYAKCWVMTSTNRRYKFIDMSSGIADQLNNAKKALGRDPKGLIIQGGLNPSDYKKELPDGTTIQARTYYLSVTPS